MRDQRARPGERWLAARRVGTRSGDEGAVRIGSMRDDLGRDLVEGERAGGEMAETCAA